MRRTVALVALAGILSLLYASKVLGHGAGAENPPGKTSGPAVTATIVLDPTFGSSTLGRTSIRLSKGTNFSGASFTYLNATNSGPAGLHYGCDSVHGADAFFVGTDIIDVKTLTDRRFKNRLLSAWIPHTSFDLQGDVLTALFTGSNVDSNTSALPSLGITIGPGNDPVITDIDNPVCTAAGKDPDTGASLYILSFTAVIQFAK